MKHLGLFAGIGGFELAARWMGWETIAWCEWDKNCQRVLKYHFPNAIPHGDIAQTDFTGYAGRVDVLTGGFPCQPYSSAGKRLGKSDDRHLWPEMLRAVREVQPRWVVGENVRGLVNWNGGMVFDEVQADLENEGYEVTPYLLPACAIGAPHRRDRIWFVAHSSENTRNNGTRDAGRYTQSVSKRVLDESFSTPNADKNTARPPGKGGGVESERSENDSKPELRGEQAEQHIGRGEFLRDAPNTPKGRLEGWNSEGADGRREPGFGIEARYRENRWEQFPTQPPVCGRDDGLSRRLDGITFPKWREFAIGAYGNAIVPQIALQIFKAIEAYDHAEHP